MRSTVSAKKLQKKPQLARNDTASRKKLSFCDTFHAHNVKTITGLMILLHYSEVLITGHTRFTADTLCTV